MCTMCAVLFVSLYIDVYVCLSCCVYKYIFCTECTKGLGLAKSTIRPALYFCLTNTSHQVPTEHHLMFAEGQICGMGNNASPKKVLHSLGQFDVFHNEAFLLQKTGKIDYSLHIQMKTVAPLVFPSTFLTGHGSGFQNSTLCKAPVCVSPFHPNDCNKREQMANFDNDT